MTTRSDKTPPADAGQLGRGVGRPAPERANGNSRPRRDYGRWAVPLVMMLRTSPRRFNEALAKELHAQGLSPIEAYDRMPFKTKRKD